MYIHAIYSFKKTAYTSASALSSSVRCCCSSGRVFPQAPFSVSQRLWARWIRRQEVNIHRGPVILIIPLHSGDTLRYNRTQDLQLRDAMTE